jgi:hypothetical protein
MDKIIKVEIIEKSFLKKYGSIISMIFIIFAALIGSYFGYYIPSIDNKHTTALMIYTDIDNLNYTLCNENQTISNSNDTPPYIFTPIYSDSGLYYSSQYDIASLNYDISQNVTRFYTDIHYAEEYRKVMKNNWDNNYSISSTNEMKYEMWIAKNQFVGAIRDAINISPYIINDMRSEYSIQKPAPNRYNSYNQVDKCN